MCHIETPSGAVSLSRLKQKIFTLKPVNVRLIYLAYKKEKTLKIVHSFTQIHSVYYPMKQKNQRILIFVTQKY